MKQVTLLIALAIIMFFTANNTFAQYADCTPDPEASDPEGNGEIDPDALPPAFVGENYNMSVTITPPPSGSGFDVTKIQLDHMENMPAGFNWETNSNNADDYMYSGEWYCVLVSGVPTGPAGVYDVTVYANAWIWAVFAEAEAPGNPQNGGTLTAYICNGLDLELGNDTTITSEDSIVLSANQNDDFHSYVWQDGSTDTTFTFYGYAVTPGTHEVYVAVYDTVGTTGIYSGNSPVCMKSDTIRITVEACELAVNLGEDINMTTDEEVVLHATNAGDNITYAWQDNSTDSTYTVDASELGEGEYEFYVTVSNDICSVSDTVNIIISTVSYEMESNKFVSIYPNPASSQITVDMENVNASTRLELINATGRIVLVQELTDNKTVIDLSRYAKGIYNLVIKQNEQHESHRLFLK